MQGDAAMPRCRSCIAGALHMRMPAFFGRSPASDAARHRMPLLVNAKPKKVPASSYVRCHDAAPFSNRPYLLGMVSTVGVPYNRRFISVFFWILFRKNNSPALCYIWEIGKPYALDNYNTEGIWFLEF